MKTQVEFTRSSIVSPALVAGAKEVGAQVEFLGIVRETEKGAAIPGLFYEAHEPMARTMLLKIFAELSVAHPCEEVCFVHRLGFVPVGEASLFVCVRAKHRQAAFQFASELIDRLKADVPVWKSDRR